MTPLRVAIQGNDDLLIHNIDYTARSFVPATLFPLFRQVQLKDGQPELFLCFIP
jgi:hypothetical protein